MAATGVRADSRYDIIYRNASISFAGRHARDRRRTLMAIILRPKMTYLDYYFLMQQLYFRPADIYDRYA